MGGFGGTLPPPDAVMGAGTVAVCWVDEFTPADAVAGTVVAASTGAGAGSVGLATADSLRI